MVNALESLSDRALREALIALRKKERALTVEVVRHLGELEHRELFAEDGYSSLFSYCTQKLGYSESGANRRIRAARTLEQTVQALVGEFLKCKSPAKRNKRRNMRRVQKTQPPTRKRAISVPLRDAVFERDSGSCSYIGPDGHRCGCKHNLEVDHIRPWAKEGSSTSENLRLLCRRHNQLEAKRHFPKR